MSNSARIVILIVVAVAAAVGIGYGIHTYRLHAAYVKANQLAEEANQQAAQLNQLAAKLEADAQQHHPELPAALAIHQEAPAKADELMKSSPDDKTGRQNAAGTFYAFYFVNTRARVDYCNEQNTSIQAFTGAFEQNNAAARETARSILKDDGSDEEKLYAAIKPQLRNMINTDMNNIASTGKTNAKGACELIAAKADFLADAMKLSKVQPAVYQALMPAK